jgi:hypothetical protein
MNRRLLCGLLACLGLPVAAAQARGASTGTEQDQRLPDLLLTAPNI